MAAQDIENLLEFGEAGFGWRKLSTLVASTASVVVKAGPGILGAVTAFNNSTNAAYVHVYNTSSSVTAGAGTPDDRFMIPGGADGAQMFNPLPDGGTHYDTGIVFTVTTGITDASTGSPATNSYLVSCYFK